MRECNLNCRWGESEGMTRVFVIGASLPRLQGSSRIIAASYRTEQLVEPILAAGHEVRLCAASYFSTHGRRRYVRRMRDGLLDYYEMNFLMADQRDQLESLCDEYSPDCVIAVSPQAGMLAAGIVGDLPLWCDLYGAIMAEAQAKAYVYNDNDFLSGFWASERVLLERGDVFSTCSTFQEHFLVGELAVMGRLNRQSFGYQFAHTIPPGVRGNALRAPRGRVLRGKLVGEDDFVILWAGGYNTWTDIDTLFPALEQVFSQNRRARFVSFGGHIDRHDDVTYARFCRMVEGSRYRSRYVLCGWRSRNDVLRAYRESDIGVNIDRYHYELVFGTRTRLVEMIAYGLPVITTVGCQLSHVIRDNDLGLRFRIGDSDGMAQSLLRYARALPASREHYSERALAYFGEHFSYAKTCEPLLSWLREPRRAPDWDVSERPVLVIDAASGEPGRGIGSAFFSLAMQNLTQRDDEGAVKMLEAFVTLRPDHTLAHYHLGSALKRLGRIDDAYSAFKRAESLAARGPEGARAGIIGGINYHLGECELARGERRDAIIRFKKCLALIPNHRKSAQHLERLGE